MNTFLENFTNNVFGSVDIKFVIFNGILGLVLVIAGVIMNKKSLSKNRKMVSIGCICIGVLAVVCAIIQVVLM